MISRNSFVFIFILFLSLWSCTEPYEINITDYENILIVQGILTNENGPYKVVLSRTIPINHTENYFEENASVTITDKNGKVEILHETSPGIYKTSNSFKGEINNEYQLKIITQDNTEYESEIVTLYEGIDIDRIYAEYNEVYDFEKNVLVPGIDIKIDTKAWDDDIDRNIFLKWDFEEVWEIEQKWNELIMGDGVWDYTIDTTQYTCWKYDYSYDIIIDNAFKYSTNKLVGKQITHLDKDNPKPFYGYSILIKQYSINESVYKFWEMMRENNIDNRNIFNNIPYNAKSNIVCCNKDLKVYGYFDASYISKQRVFFKSPVEGVDFRDFNSECKRHGAPMSFLEMGPKIYILLMDAFEVFYTKQEYCVNCSVVSTTKQRPEYWIY